MPSRPPIFAYMWAIVLPLATFDLEAAFPGFFEHIPFFLFIVTVCVTALLFRTGPGLVATAVSTAGVVLLFERPVTPRHLIQTILFAATGLAVTLLTSATTRARARLIEEREAFGQGIARERERLLGVISNVPGVVWEAWGEPDSQEQRTDFVSDHITRMLGYSVEEWLSTPNFWLSIVHPDDREAAAQNAREHFAAGGTATNRFRWMTKDGRAIWCESRSTVITDGKGRAIGMRGVTVDATARKRADDAIRFLGAVSEALATSLDFENTVPQAAELAAQFMGGWCAITYTDREGQARRLAIAHSDPAQRETVKRLLAFPISERAAAPATAPRPDLGQPTILNDVDDAFIDSRATGPEHAAVVRELGMRSLLIAPMVARDRLVGAISFISERPGRFDSSDGDLAMLFARRLAIAIENAELYRTAVESSNAKDEFLATISHELRTPMTATLGWVRLLSLGGLDPDTYKTALEAIDRSTRAQARLVEDIIDVSSVMLGKIRIDQENVDLRQVIEASLEAIRPAAEAKLIRIRFDSSQWHGAILGDPDRLQQVVWNLVSNAIKFGKASGSIDVTLKRSANAAIITVEDDGSGIDADFLPHVFDRFRQAERGMTRGHGGLGLGLAIVRHLTELHGGTVTAFSEGAGRGARFVVELPAIGTDVEAGAARASASFVAPSS